MEKIFWADLQRNTGEYKRTICLKYIFYTFDLKFYFYTFDDLQRNTGECERTEQFI